MIDEYNETSLWFGIPGLCMQGLGWAMGGIGSTATALSGTVVLIGTALLITGLCYYAKAKGQPAHYGLLGLVSCLGLLILALLPDRAKDGQAQITANKDGQAQITANKDGQAQITANAVGMSNDLPLPGSPVMVTERMTGSADGTPTVGRSYASYQVSMPGILLMALGGLTTAISLLGVVINASDLIHPGSFKDTGSAVVLIVSLIQVFLGGLIFFGGLKMRNLTNYGLALAASIIVLIPYPCLGLGIPVGVWALVVLNKPAVKAAFPQT